MAEAQVPANIFRLTYKLGKLTLKLAISAFAPSSTQQARHTQLIGDVRDTIDRLEAHFASTADPPRSFTVYGRSSGSEPPQTGLPRSHNDPVELDATSYVQSVEKDGVEVSSDSTEAQLTGKPKQSKPKKLVKKRLQKIEENAPLQSGTSQGPASLKEEPGEESTSGQETDSGPLKAVQKSPQQLQGLLVVGPASDTEITGITSTAEPQDRPADYQCDLPNQGPSKSPSTKLDHSKRVDKDAPCPSLVVPYAQRPTDTGNYVRRPETVLNDMASAGQLLEEGSAAATDPDPKDVLSTRRELGPVLTLSDVLAEWNTQIHEVMMTANDAQNGMPVNEESGPHGHKRMDSVGANWQEDVAAAALDHTQDNTNSRKGPDGIAKASVILRDSIEQEEAGVESVDDVGTAY
ncbi:hypothetical protein NX059_010831 [Plenodomus lindquistii]|nr:hypothetical protein NX059_010831 [Plenodomus lindquistii]